VGEAGGENVEEEGVRGERKKGKESGKM